MKELFKSLDGIDISGFVFMYREFNTSPGLSCMQGYLTLNVKYNKEDSQIVCCVFNGIGAKEFMHKFIPVKETFTVDELIVILDGYVEQYHNNSVKR